MRALLLAALALCGCKMASEGPVVRIAGIRTDKDPRLQAKQNEAMAAYLSESMKAQVEYVPIPSVRSAVKALSEGKVDLAFLPGFDFLHAQKDGAVPVVGRGRDRSVFIAAADAPVETIEDLAWKKFTFGKRSSVTEHLMPRHFLAEKGLHPSKSFDGKADHAPDPIAAVAAGNFVVGAANAARKIDEDKVKVIWTSPPYANHVWAARKGFDPKLQEAFSKAMQKAPIEILAIQAAALFEPVKASDYEALEKIARAAAML